MVGQASLDLVSRATQAQAYQDSLVLVSQATQATQDQVYRDSQGQVSQAILALEYRVILAQELVVGLDSQDLVCQDILGKMVVSGLADSQVILGQMELLHQDSQGTQVKMVVSGLADSQVIRAVMVVSGHQVLVDTLGHPLQGHLDSLVGLASLVMVLL